jgi:NAD(P)-dependent dehydrogenase (short-subunit alcohol dehydrogenase family)
MSLLKNKIAIVTGGGSGIGLATAKRFVEEGAYVFIAGRRQAELDKAVAEIGKKRRPRSQVKPRNIADLHDMARLELANLIERNLLFREIGGFSYG